MSIEMFPLTDAEKEFMRGLDELTRKTGVCVYGCGCCSSPSLYSLDGAETEETFGYFWGSAGELKWASIDEAKKYNYRDINPPDP